MPPAGFKSSVSAGKQPQTYALDCVATRTGGDLYDMIKNILTSVNKINTVLGVFAKLQEVTVGFFMSVCPPVWNGLTFGVYIKI